MDAPSKISVIIPSYNAAPTIVDAVESVLSQTWPEVECLLIDDGSTDNTEDLLKPYLNKVRYIKKKNGGFASARNLGMQKATGDFIAWLDADDIFEPDKLERQMAFIEAQPSLGLVCSDFSLFDQSGEISSTAIKSYYGIFDRGIDYGDIFEHAEKAQDGVDCWYGRVFDSLLLGNFIHPPTVLFRKSVFEKVGPQSEYLVNATDYEYLTRIAQDFDVGFINAPLLRYRISDSQSSSPKNFAKNTRYNEMAIRHMLANFLLSDAQQTQLRKRLSEMRLALARHLAEGDKLVALRYFIMSQARHFPTTKSLIVFLKILTPSALIAWRRNKYVAPVKHGF